MAEYSGLKADDDVEPVYQKAIKSGGVFALEEGCISLNVTLEHWESFYAVLGCEKFTADDHPFATVGGRVANAWRLRTELETVLTRHTAQE